MSSDPTIYSRVAACVEACAGLISSHGMDEVHHFLDHGEWEMAFEGLVLELMSVNATPAGFDANVWRALGQDLGLMEGGVFIGDFWNQFVSWLESRPA